MTRCRRILNAMCYRTADRPGPCIQGHLVLIAPAPVLAWLERSDDGMLRGMEMLGGVPILGAIATADITAGHAQPQMEPGITGLQTVLTAVSTLTPEAWPPVGPPSARVAA